MPQSTRRGADKPRRTNGTVVRLMNRKWLYVVAALRILLSLYAIGMYRYIQMEQAPPARVGLAR